MHLVFPRNRVRDEWLNRLLVQALQPIVTIRAIGYTDMDT
jgi:hypothetical protein